MRIDRIRAESPHYRQAYVDGAGEGMNRNEIETIYPLSPMQQGILLQSVCPRNQGVSRPALLATTGRLQRRSLPARLAAGSRTSCHPRSAFSWKSAEKNSRGLSQRAAAILRRKPGLSPAEQEQRIAAYLHADRLQSLDLSKAPLMRIALFTLAPGRTPICLETHHHIIIDGLVAGGLVRR